MTTYTIVAGTYHYIILPEDHVTEGSYDATELYRSRPHPNVVKAQEDLERCTNKYEWAGVVDETGKDVTNLFMRV